jgi:hypothetical protein
LRGILSKFVNMDTGQVKIFTSRDVPRLSYIADILLGDLLGLSWEIVTDRRKLGKNPVINYSNETVKNSFSVIPTTLLFESDIRLYDISISEWRGLPVFFQTPEESDLPFDIFAASFYLISRYEEYTYFQPDEHGRFRASYSLAYKNGFLDKPVVDLWAREWAKVMVLKFQSMVFKKNVFKSLVTIDIDQPFEYRGKDLFRSLGGFLHDVGKRQGKTEERFRTISRGEKDPWDVFDYIFERIEETGTEARFFIPTGDRSDFDKQPSWHNDDYRKLILNISRNYKTGLHPSYFAYLDSPKLKIEKTRLHKIISKDISSSRFHYLRIKFPESFRNLIHEGFKEDYSIGYHDEPGFRAGIARPFNFYDLGEEKETDITIIPFQVMDGTLSQYKNMTPEEARSVIQKIIEETRKAGGLFVSIWHNTSLLDNTECTGWREVFESTLKLQQE